MSIATIPLKHRARVIAGQSPDSSDVELFQDGLPFLQGKAEFGVESPTPRYQCDTPKKICQPGDILVSVRAPVGSVNTADRAYGIGRGLAAVRACGGNSRFLKWVMEQSAQQLQSIATGSTFEAISADDLASLQVPAIAAVNEHLVADFLDRGTAKIDALIEKQASLIGALRARRQEAIRHAVLGHDRPPLKALNPTSPWVPEIPYTWNFLPVGYQYDVVLGKMLDAGRAPREDDSDLQYIRAANIQDAGLDLSSVNSMPFTPLEAIKFSLRSGDLLVVEGGSVGVSVVLGDDMDGWAFQETVNRVRSRGDSSTRYLHYVLNAYRNAGVFGIICGGSTIAHLTAEKLAALRIPVPPLEEQHEIVDRLNRETARIDELIAKSERLIELSRERRSALVTAAVTGQIDVREMESSEEAA